MSMFQSLLGTLRRYTGLVEAGFEYVCITPDGLMIFRKRK